MYGYRIPFEFRLSTRLMYALVNLAPVNKGRAADYTLSSGNKNQMMIYGIVTWAFLYTDDGNRSEMFHVDGGVENTRLGWNPQGRLNEDITAGAHIELDAQLSNAAGDLNLIGTESTEQTAWGIRIQEVTATHRRYGKVSLGKADTASTERVTVDLSGSDLAVGNNPADMAGGIHFYNRTTGGRTITIGDVIDKVDGIDKDNRIRYDCPEFGGVGPALSYVAGGVWDAGLGYAREWGSFEFEMWAYYANVSARSTDDEDLWGGSGSLKHKSGLSITLTGAIKGRKGTG